jgi:NTE family protein
MVNQYAQDYAVGSLRRYDAPNARPDGYEGKEEVTTMAPKNENGKKRIAIGCQGGGVHSAFGAGALKRLLREEQHEVVALSGTSGGAICAFLAWYALLESEGAQAADKAAELLDSYWRDNSANDLYARYLNDWTVWMSRVEGATALVEVSPYDSPLSSRIRDQLRKTLEKQRVDFENLEERLGPTSPVLLVSAIDVVSGSAKNFDSRNGEISVDALLASTAVPPVFEAAHVDGSVYWDALFCQNPPLREMARMKPDEIWVIQVTPWSRGFEPKKVADIMDRRNELSGNVAMSQDVYLIEKINELVDALGEGENKEVKWLRLPREEGKEYRHIEVRVIEMSAEKHQNLDFASKIDRRPSFVRELMDHGEERTEELLQG